MASVEQRRSSAWALFSNRDFTLLLLSRFCSVTAMQILSVAISWQVYQRTGLAIDLGLIGLAQFLPALILMPVTGEVADRVDRRLVVAVSMGVGLACAISFYALMYRATGPIWPVYGVLLVSAASRAFGFTAQQALTPTLVSREDLGRAIAWSSSFNNVATIGGPALGGILLSFSAGEGYLVAAALLGIATLGMIAIRTRPAQAAPRAVSIKEISAGMRFVAGHSAILGVISLDLFAVLLGDVTALLPIYAKDILGVGSVGLGLLRSAPSIGAVLAGLALAQWPLGKRAGRTMLAALVIYGVSTVVFALSHLFILSIVALLVLGSADMMSVYVRSTLVQTATPDRMRGRVSAVNALFINTSNQIGQFESGLAAACFGTVPAAVIGGLGAIVIALSWGRLFPSLPQVDLSPPGLKLLAESAQVEA